MPQHNYGHGHVIPRSDGVKARCGGPSMCDECSRDAARINPPPTPMPAPPNQGPAKVHEIHSSGMSMFRRCRRRWEWSEVNRWQSRDLDTGALWLGTGFHFALEDFHGYRRFHTPGDALEAYASAHPRDERPTEYDKLLRLGLGMLSYYVDHWLPRRDEFRTLWIDGVPQVEVPFKLAIGACGCCDPPQPVTFGGTFDRVVTDAYDRLWIVETKTAKRFDTAKLPTDAQVSDYSLAGSVLYGDRLEGVLFQQFLKEIPDYPARLQNGRFSVAKAASTTYALYVAALMSEYGEVPQSYVEHTNWLAAQETEEGDTFIRRDTVRRSRHQWRAAYNRIMDQTTEMLNPRLFTYPNPSHECSWCPFRSACIARDEGADYMGILEADFTKQTNNGIGQWQPYQQSWRESLQYPTLTPASGTVLL